MPIKKITDTGQTSTTLDQFGRAGFPSRLTIVPVYKDETETMSRARVNDTSARSFHVRARLAKAMTHPKGIEVNFDAETGGSFFIASTGEAYEISTTNDVKCTIELNSRRELAAVSFRCDAYSSGEARLVFHNVVRPLLDYFCYLADVPYHIDQISIVDELHHIQDVEVFHSEISKVLGTGATPVLGLLVPYYAMYREGKNSTSMIYKFFCYYKILDGLMTALQPKLKKAAKAAGISSESLVHLVPEPTEHDFYDSKQMEYVGKSMQLFMSEYLTKRYRDAVAHFVLKDGTTLNVSDLRQIDKYVSILPIVENCCRKAIGTFEHFLSQNSLAVG
ncbi:methylamine utilization protein MauJ [Burkholderia ubonensis]|uniref:methylamine utilization protein MauJ n=1 Tax=Burkholderia ubonensis TaxID=101571 RepID=UPI0010569EAE|nr:methylamine utilization protein MauJ [Burkholderia ubonensis]